MIMTKPGASAPDAERVTERPKLVGRTSDVRGVIDNMTPDRLLGWAWDFGHPEHRVTVALRIAGETVAEGIADRPRPDLAKAGIGDGAHAFDLPLSPEVRGRLQEATVVAFGLDGREFQIAARLPRREEAPAGNPVQRMVDGVATEQRELKQELATLRDRLDRLPPGEVIESAGRVGETLQARIGQLELWLTRLDSQLGDLAAEAPPPQRTGVDAWQAVLYALLASLSAGALAAAIAHRLV
ncbi:hypothetical protein [Paracraurococcus lichenis]|uniref:Uncharacterized protein n=1 Tax=Paracraurococcus lichenis TaxID=3064888 RepID=A0ABT9E5H7_9PROT|nr:hypothetical protein [Paracraurococcus sp. LOR1-02]MDO9711416.1 hypothetical protein [Paracraurococcus sp. LOR1-02]